LTIVPRKNIGNLAPLEPTKWLDAFRRFLIYFSLEAIKFSQNPVRHPQPSITGDGGFYGWLQFGRHFFHMKAGAFPMRNTS